MLIFHSRGVRTKRVLMYYYFYCLYNEKLGIMTTLGTKEMDVKLGSTMYIYIYSFTVTYYVIITITVHPR